MKKEKPIGIAKKDFDKNGEIMFRLTLREEFYNSLTQKQKDNIISLLLGGKLKKI